MAKKEHFRKDFPSDFKGQSEAQDKIFDYINGLPAGNVFDLFMASEGIDPIVNAGKKVTAKGYNDLKLSKAESSHLSIQKRNNKMDKFISHMEDGFQYIKRFNPELPLEAAAWGANISVEGTITMPSNPGDLLAMFKVYSDKHATYPLLTSPLHGFYIIKEWNMANDVIDYLAADVYNTGAADTSDESELNTELRNNEWEQPLKDMIKLYNLARIVYKDTFRLLTVMGFKVVSTPPTHHNQTSTALQMAHVLIHGAIIGSVIENLNDFDVLIHPGHDIGLEPKLLKAHELMAVEKGMSQFVFENKDPLRIAKIVSTIRKHG